jgi:xanthine dehydrogenase YagS FAD-binding subunit
LEATIQVQGPKGKRSISIHEFYLLPGLTPNRETVLEPGDVIVSVTLPPPVAGAKSHYLKLRDRAAYEFALASAAVVLKLNGNKIEYARIALGGVGTRPWRSLEAERVLKGNSVNAALFRRAAQEALKDARPASENGFKVELAKRCIVRALTTSTMA